jgi:hypothetical protein
MRQIGSVQQGLQATPALENGSQNKKAASTGGLSTGFIVSA